MFWIRFTKKLVIIVKNESILNTFSSSLPLNYLHESHGVSKGIVLNRPDYWKSDIFVQKLLIWKFFLEFFENLVKRDFLFRIWTIGNLVCVKTCYSFKNTKSLPMTKNPNSVTMNPWFHSQLIAWEHFDQENKIIHCLITSLWAITFSFDRYDMNNLGSKENPFNVFLFNTCAYLESGTLSRDTLCDSMFWPKWVNEKMKKKNEKKRK